MSQPYAAIILSPHLDDAVLSCGGQLAHRARHGERVLVVTVFSGEEPAGEISALARKLHGYFGLDAGVIAHRKAEDLEACRRLGVEAEHLDLTEAIYRRDAETGAPLYPTLASLFEELRPADEPSINALEQRLHDLPPAGEYLVPLAVGNHVDHQIVRRAAERCLDEPIYYEDYPYIERRGALARAHGPRHDWTPRVILLSESDLAAKVEACAAHASQIRPLFRSRWRMKRRLRRWSRKVGGERLWIYGAPGPGEPAAQGSGSTSQSPAESSRPAN